MAYQAGDLIFDVTWPGASREQIGLFSQGTQDPNPIHVDDDFARRAGFPQVLQQGPMTTTHFARLLEQQVGRDRLKVLDVTFTAPVFPEETLRLVATVRDPGGPEVTCELSATKEDGTQAAKGEAVIAA